MKNLFKGLTILFTFLLFTSCEKGEIIPNDKKFDLYYFAKNDVTQISAKIAAETRLDFFTKSDDGTNAYWVDEENILGAIDSDGNKSFFYRLYFENMPINTYYNIVVTERDYDEIVPFVLEYKFEDGEKKSMRYFGLSYFANALNKRQESIAYLKNGDEEENGPIDINDCGDLLGGNSSGSDDSSSSTGGTGTAGNVNSTGNSENSYNPLGSYDVNGDDNSGGGGGSRVTNFEVGEGVLTFPSIALKSSDDDDRIICPEGEIIIIENLIKLLNELTNDCAKEIFEDLLEEKRQSDIKPEVTLPNNETLTFSGQILNMFNTSNQFDLRVFNSNRIKEGVAGVTTITGLNSDSGRYDIEIELFDSYLAQATDLSITATMIHEATHAYMIYRTGTDGDYAAVLQTYSEVYGREGGRSHHEFMSEYVNAMAYSLYTWDKNYTVDGGNKGWDHYYAMAFRGMWYKDSNNNTVLTDGFHLLVPDANERKKILEILVNEQEGNGNAKGKKCD